MFLFAIREKLDILIRVEFSPANNNDNNNNNNHGSLPEIWQLARRLGPIKEEEQDEGEA